MFMLVLHLASVALLYRTARKLGCGLGATAVGCVLFSISPLAVFYGRLVLLDNIMVFWALLSLDLVLDREARLSRLVLSGVCFGLACLSKETAVVLAPPLLILVHQQRQRHHGTFGLASWLAPMLLVLSWYPLYAALKNELLPAGQSILFVIQGSTTGSTSLTDALKWQATRGGGGAFNLDNQFWQLVRGDWITRDALLVLGGTAATGLNLLRSLVPRRVRSRRSMAVCLLGLLPLGYLGRGGVVFDFYILAAIPFLCLNVAFAINPLMSLLRVRLAEPMTIVLTSAILTGYLQANTVQPLYTQHPGLAGREAIPWIKQHLAPDSRVITPDDLWTDLHEAGSTGPAFPNVQSHWKVAADPEIRDGVFHADWRSVDYVIMAPGLEDAFQASDDRIALDALHNAHLVKDWQADGSSIGLWKVDRAGSTEDRLLSESAGAIVERFEHSRLGEYQGGDGSVLSETQAYALLRDVWSNDRVDFDRTWGWTTTNLVGANGLPGWLWRDGSVTDAHTASDADTDMALALLMAGRRWNDPVLLGAGQSIVRAIWQHEVVSVAGQPILSAGDWISDGRTDHVAFNPSYFAPYAYRIFAEADPEHDWAGVTDSGYRTLFALSQASLGAARYSGLPPDWVGLDRATGTLTPLPLPGKSDTTVYGFDAPRTYWRVALDRLWSGDGRADAYLDQSGFLRDEVARKGRPSSVYGHDGSVVEDAFSMVGTAGALAALGKVDPSAAHGLFASEVLGGLQMDPGGRVWWGNADSVYDQAWGWFATALYANRLPDLWHAS
ncbi:MAG: glycosyl hydrolase family 8 [Chloroflexota bacterium]